MGRSPREDAPLSERTGRGSAARTRVCFVCWGNICRSPTAEGVMRQLVAEAGLSDRIEVDSAGTSTEELGNPVDPRAVKEAARRGLTLEHVARQFQSDDFDRYDLVLVADELNMRRMRRLARTADDDAKLHMIREFDPDFDPSDPDVPDPWYGGADGFVYVYDVLEASCRGLLDQLR
ncbi:MAG TPA: low molecular weight protein-tyrosine-phosphatase [Acidimicrobiales bacterium]|nr:low molecular weight protein-tyrosine-phosphatase [Acidimicrobiales bacterium]